MLKKTPRRRRFSPAERFLRRASKRPQLIQRLIDHILGHIPGSHIHGLVQRHIPGSTQHRLIAEQNRKLPLHQRPRLRVVQYFAHCDLVVSQIQTIASCQSIPSILCKRGGRRAFFSNALSCNKAKPQRPVAAASVFFATAPATRLPLPLFSTKTIKAKGYSSLRRKPANQA